MSNIDFYGRFLTYFHEDNFTDDQLEILAEMIESEKDWSMIPKDLILLYVIQIGMNRTIWSHAEK